MDSELLAKQEKIASLTKEKESLLRELKSAETQRAAWQDERAQQGEVLRQLNDSVSQVGQLLYELWLRNSTFITQTIDLDLSPEVQQFLDYQNEGFMRIKLFSEKSQLSPCERMFRETLEFLKEKEFEKFN